MGLCLGTLVRLLRARRSLLIENLALRQQLVVLKRQHPRPRLDLLDKLFLVAVNPAPRIGFAWDPTGSGNTSIRGGYGIFFEHGTGNETNTGSQEGSAPLVLDMTASFPFTYELIGKFGPNKVAFPLNVTSIQKRAICPYMQQWSLSVQEWSTNRDLARLMIRFNSQLPNCYPRRFQ